ncbi:unnamed protein product [Kluyveromyces dobzhanskii CBS 2104]|uniref:WGS project CCBQ000000000 data, contig 00106 n=1 Tax=Kluyveromyces dobzhanskii CBS 2104 TaxID=1427455 RepID=A0A0A8L7N7_9SACH|nr:unnamed protein product [Kluyveromyces dobzhanskii CBS 2104]
MSERVEEHVVNDEPMEEKVDNALDDLFGDESEEEDQQIGSDDQENDSDDSSSAKSHRRVIDDEEDEEQAMYNRKFLGEDIEGQSEEEDERKYKEVDVDIVKHVVPYKTGNSADDKTIYYAKIPQFLTIDPVPFDPPTFQRKVEDRVSKYSSKEDQLGDRLIEENTIRWRYSRDKDQRVFKESNAQVVQWSDGSFSLKVGDEYTDILVNNTENTYLTVSHEEQELIQCVEGGEITKTMMFVPTSTNSKVHKVLSKAVARREEREAQGPNTYIVRTDPELEKRELEKKHDQVLRERRKKQLKEKLELENAGESPEPQFNLQKNLSKRHNLDEYEYDDGFVAQDDEDDEEEEEEEEDEEEESSGDDNGVAEGVDESDGNESEQENENAERLRQVKQAGAKEYQEDSQAKKRRIAVLDDEDDE